jgi:hypothetical protein
LSSLIYTKLDELTLLDTKVVPEQANIIKSKMGATLGIDIKGIEKPL